MNVIHRIHSEVKVLKTLYPLVTGKGKRTGAELEASFLQAIHHSSRRFYTGSWLRKVPPFLSA